MPTLFSKLAFFFFFCNVCADIEFLRPHLPPLKKTHIQKLLLISTQQFLKYKLKTKLLFETKNRYNNISLLSRARGYVRSVFLSWGDLGHGVVKCTVNLKPLGIMASFYVSHADYPSKTEND